MTTRRDIRAAVLRVRNEWRAGGEGARDGIGDIPSIDGVRSGQDISLVGQCAFSATKAESSSVALFFSAIL